MITGDQVLARRKELKLSRQKFADLVGLTPAKIHNIENGRELRPEEEELIAPHMNGTSPSPLPKEDKPKDKPKGQRTVECPQDGCRAQVVLDAEEGGSCWSCKSKVHSDGSLASPGKPTGNPVTTPQQPATDEPEASGADQPVVIPSEDELEERDAGEPAPLDVEVREDLVIGSGLPEKFPFEREGYHVTNSELQTLKRCPRKWYLAYYRELKLKHEARVGARALGTRMHLALASYYSTREEDPMEVLEATILEDRKALTELEDVEALDELEKEADLARAMMEGYLEWCKETGADEGLEIIGDEMIVEADFPAIPGVVLVGKMDLRVRREIDGARLFLDHKTVGSLTDPVKRLHMNEQMLHYHLLEFLEFLQAGMDAESAQKEQSHGGLYNMIKKVKRTTRAKPPFFDRVEVRHNIHELRSYYVRVFGEVNRILELRQQLDAGADHRQVAFPNPTRDCSWDCDFFMVCPMFDDGSAAEAMLQEYYVQGDPHGHYYPYGESQAE